MMRLSPHGSYSVIASLVDMSVLLPLWLPGTNILRKLQYLKLSSLKAGGSCTLPMDPKWPGGNWLTSCSVPLIQTSLPSLAKSGLVPFLVIPTQWPWPCLFWSPSKCWMRSTRFLRTNRCLLCHLRKILYWWVLSPSPCLSTLSFFTLTQCQWYSTFAH